MSRISLVFYIENWRTSKAFRALNFIERYIYLECLFQMYHDEAPIPNNKTEIEYDLRGQIPDEIWQKVTARFDVLEDGSLWSDTVEKRLNAWGKNKVNAVNGAQKRAKDSNKRSAQATGSTDSLKRKPQRNDQLREVKESKVKPTETSLKEVVGREKANGIKPPNGSPSPLYAVGMTAGSVDLGQWKKYGEHLQKILPGLDRDRMAKAWRNYWPHSIGPDQSPTIEEFIAAASDNVLRHALDEIGELLILGETEAFIDPIDFATRNLTP